MSKVIRYMPELQGEEQVRVAQHMTDLTEEQAENFAKVYRLRRKDETGVLIMALVGFLGMAGIHRFYLGHIGMGLLYFFTFGLCGIGTIVDLFNHKTMTAKYNIEQSDDVAYLIKGAFPETPRTLASSNPPLLEEPPPLEEE
jgi:TM2 domain-containing membrane protein YozV